MGGIRSRLAGARDRAVDMIADLSPRDRTLLMGLLAFAAILLIGGGAWWMNRTIHELEGRLADRRQTLQNVRELDADYAAAVDRSNEIQQRLRESAGTDLSSFLEQAASKANIREKLSAVREKSASTDDVLEEKIYAVSLDRLTLDEFVDFLYQAETAGYPMQILNLKVKTRKKGDEKLLNVDLDVAAYRVLSEPEADGSEG